MASSFVVSGRITAGEVPIALFADPAQLLTTVKFEAIGKLSLISVVVPDAVGVIPTDPETVTTLPTLIH